MTQTNAGENIVEVYADEVEKIDQLLKAVQQRWGNKQFTPATQQEFEKDVVGRFEKIGFVAHVGWLEPDTPEGLDPMDAILWEQRQKNDGPKYVVPDVQLVGRIEKQGEFDHDRQKHGIIAGKMDGVKGVIDPNTGKLKEESKSKLIF